MLTGLLLFAVGFGNQVAGRSKITQYEELLHATTPPAQPDPASLFPRVSEGQERYEIARAKLSFYNLLVTAGQLLSAFGVTLVAFGILRLWMRAPRPPANSAVTN